MKTITVELKIKNIGPIKSLDFNDSLGSLKMLILAKNGTGKTFIGRNFCLIQEKDKIQDMDLNHMLNFNSTDGNFKFKVSNQTGNISDLEINYSNKTQNFIERSNKYIYHCFNHEFVDKNLREKKFNPNGNFEGFIIGERQISLDEEELKVSLIEQKIKENTTKLAEDKEQISNIINNKKEDLKNKAKLQGKLAKIYDEIMFDKFNDINYKENEISSYENLVSDYSKFNSIPETLSEVELIKFDILKSKFTLNYSVLKNLLETSYNRGKFSDDFKIKINSKKIFVEEGIKIYHELQGNCPFCCQEIKTKETLDLINMYEKYLADEENVILSRLNHEIFKIGNLIKEINNFYTTYMEREQDFNTKKLFFSTFKDITLNNIKDEKDYIISILELIIKKYEEKKENIEEKISSDIIGTIDIEIIGEKCKRNNEIIENINKIIRNSSSEKTKIRTNLVKSISNEVYNYVKSDIANYNNFKLDTENLNNSYIQEKKTLEAKKNENIISKQEKYEETFLNLLKIFFGEKYSYCKEKSCIILRERVLSEGIDKVLSEGEKSVIAFCYYLASTHNLINVEADYKKVFFIIDDPISSMDYTYTYTLSQILRNINNYFEKMDERQKIILLTHNFEFASLLARNNIFNNLYHLNIDSDSNHILKKIDKKFIYPYEEHLLSIYKISTGTELPTYTAGNSIRYVLESLMRFCNPQLENLENFISEDSILSRNGEIYSLVNDLSHGNIGGELSLVSTIDTNLIEICKTVIEHIKSKFPNKLDGII